MFKPYGFVFLAILLQCVLVYGQSTRCYFCNTEVHGQGCNDPIDPYQIQMQNCADSEIIPNETYFSKLKHFFGHAGILSENTTLAITDTYPNVCIYMTYQFNSRNISARGCETSHVNISEEAVDICEYYAMTIPSGRVINFNCTICNEDLCNFENYVENYGGGSNTISISLEVIVTMLLAKLFM